MPWPRPRFCSNRSTAAPAARAARAEDVEDPQPGARVILREAVVPGRRALPQHDGRHAGAVGERAVPGAEAGRVVASEAVRPELVAESAVRVTVREEAVDPPP